MNGPFVVNVAVVGKMCTGKTSISDCVRQHSRKCPFVRVSFAGRIKELAVELFGMSPAEKDRDLLSYIGATMRARDKSVWIRCVTRAVAEFNRQGISVIVDDCRMRTELDALREAGFMLVKCEAAATIRLFRLRQLYPETYSQHTALMNSVTECDLDHVPLSEYEYLADESKTVQEHADCLLQLIDSRYDEMCADVAGTII